MNPISVSELNTQIKYFLESNLSVVYLKAEISKITFHESGHVYFDVKDKTSSISCIMFRGNFSRVKFKLEKRMSVLIKGAINVYVPRGSYSLNCTDIEPDGIGALALAYEQLKKNLEKKGYFANKKPLPSYPKHIVIITSNTGAALHDMLSVAKKRWQLVKLTLIDSLVQGENAKYSIAKALNLADKQNADLILLARGGGSIEDLWCFNEELVADAIFACKTPVVSAIGHESDYLISDFVADKRAPTPSAAMEIILPDTTEKLMYIDEKQAQINADFKQLFAKKAHFLKYLTGLLELSSPQKQLQKQINTLHFSKNMLHKNYKNFLENKSVHLALSSFSHEFLKDFLAQKNMILSFAIKHLELLNPSKIKKGNAQISQNSKLIFLQDLKVGDEFNLQDSTQKVVAKILKVKKT